MAGVSGKTAGVGADIVEYLDAVGEHYGYVIKVTSGKRSPEEQGKAMFDNWIQLKRGNVYKSETLPDADKKALDAHYVTAVEDDKATPEAKTKAEAAFKKLAADKVGKKSKHATGRAVDVVKSGLPAKVYKAITLHMKEVPEGRTDIHHFESAKVPAASEDVKAKWPAK